MLTDISIPTSTYSACIDEILRISLMLMLTLEGIVPVDVLNLFKAELISYSSKFFAASTSLVFISFIITSLGCSGLIVRADSIRLTGFL